MAKRKKRVVTTKKKKNEDNDDADEPMAKKLAVSSSTNFLDDDSSQTETTSFSVEGVNIGKSDTVGGEVGFSSHFWCNYCEYSSDTKKELVTHMRQHMTKCSYCNFSSLSKAEIAKHVKCEHAEEAEKAICEVDSSVSSGTEHDMDKDPCSACIFCDFMTYSTEHLEKHTTSKHQGMLPKSVAKMISKQVSARIRRDDALFYFTISSDSFDKTTTEGESMFGSKTFETNERNFSIAIQNVDVKPSISPQSPVQNLKEDLKPHPNTLSQIDSGDMSQTQDKSKTDDWRVKVETLYCLSCAYSNVAVEKLKCHALTQHPDSVAAASYTSETTHRLQDITFYCARESCSYSSVQCREYEEHLMKCCFIPDSLLFGEKERLKETIGFIFKCQDQHAHARSKDFLEYSSQYLPHQPSYASPSPTIESPTVHCQMQNDSLSNDGSNTQFLANKNNATVSSSQSDSSSMQMPIDTISSHNSPENSNCNTSETVNRQQQLNGQNANMHLGQAFTVDQAFSSHQRQVLNSDPLDSSHGQNSKSSTHQNTSQQNSNLFLQSKHNHHSQEPLNVNLNTNTVSSGQHLNTYIPQPVPNPEPIIAPSFDSSLPLISSQNPTQSSFTQPQTQTTDQSMSTDLTSTTNQQPELMSSQPLHHPPKMLDLLSDANEVLLDNDLSIQPWPATESHNTLPSQNTSHSQSSLHTPPLPQANTNNLQLPTSGLSIPHTSSAPIQTSTTLPTLFPDSNSDPSHHNQSQLSIQPSITEAVIDLDNAQSYTDPMSTLQSSQHNFEIPTTNYDNSNANLVETTPQQPMAVPEMPNFLVPSSSTSESTANDSQPPDSFLDNTFPSQPSSDQTVPMDYPSTPPSQKHIAPSRFPAANAPLSPSIYLNGGGGPDQQKSSSTDNSPMQFAGSSPMGPPFRSPAPQGMNFNGQQPTSNVRQRLFSTRGQPRGTQQSMARPQIPPAENSVDDDVIVTAVVRSPARSPMSPRGRGMAPGGRGMAPSGRGMAPNQRGMVPNARGMAPNGRGMAPNGRGIAPRGRSMGPGGRGMPPGGRGVVPGGRGMAPNVRGRAGLPVQRGRVGIPRGRGGAMPPNMSQERRLPDVREHFGDLACGVNSNEEDEIQIVGVTPGKSGAAGTPQPKAVDAKKFSYCCIHCGQDQGSKDNIKTHIKLSHSESLLGAIRNTETSQWLYFCPQLTCNFMTYEESRLINHLFACYNLDKKKPLPPDMQSALRNLKALRMRYGPPGMGGQGVRNAFNNNLKNAFDDMVEKTVRHQMIQPNQSSPQQPPPSPSFTNQRGALRGPYGPRGTPPKNVRQGFPGVGQMSPGYRQRSPMMVGSPRQPRYPGSPIRPRGSNPQFPSRGLPPGRGAPPLPMRGGQRPPNPRGGFTPRPRFAGPGMPGNEQSPIIIDLDADSPGKATDGDNDTMQETCATIVPDNASHTPMDAETLPTYTTTQVTTPNSVDQSTSGVTPLTSNVFSNTYNTQTVTSDAESNNVPTSASTLDDRFPVSDSNVISSPSNQLLSADPSSTTIENNEVNNATSDITLERQLSSHTSTSPSADNAPTSQTIPSNSDNTSPLPTSVKDVPSPSQLIADMNSMTSKQVTPTQLSAEITPNPTTTQESRSSPSEQNPSEKAADIEVAPENDEELVNKILLDKVFAKVPHMPKKLSQRLVLKFKKYAADRGMIITPTSRVIDEFVSKISYKGSHSAPTPIGQENKNNTENNLPSQPEASLAKTSLQSINHPDSANLGPKNSDTANLNPSSVSSPQPDMKTKSSLPSSSPSPKSNSNSIGETAELSQNVSKSDDVIETKVIYPERKLQFKGAFANIIKEKNASPSNPISPFDTLTSDNSDHFSHVADKSNGTDSVGDQGVLTKNLKKEVIEPILFPSVSKENPIEVKSSVDHIVSGYASLEVDIAGKPVSASDFSEKEDKSTGGNPNAELQNSKIEEVSEKNNINVPSIECSSGTLKFKIRKGAKPRVEYSGNKEHEIVQEKNSDSNDSFPSSEDQSVRRSDRKRKLVKVDYDPQELDEMSELMSDDDDEYHVESDDSYDGSDSEGWGKKKAKKIKTPTDPTAFDVITKGCFGCWKCTKVFSRVMFLKRHITKKHKEGLCALVFTESGVPSKDQPSVLLYCPQSCKYVTSDCDAYASHLESCTESPVTDIDYRSIQTAFFKNEYNGICESVASGVICTKIPVKATPTPRKKSLSSGSKPDLDGGISPSQTIVGNGSQPAPQAQGTTLVTTTATIHHQPPSNPQTILPPYSPCSNPQQQREEQHYPMPHEGNHDSYYGDEMMHEEYDADMLYPEEQY